MSLLAALESLERPEDIAAVLKSARWRLHPDLYRRIAPIADTTGRSDVRAMVCAVAAPELLDIRLLARSMAEADLARLIRRRVDHAIRQSVEVTAEHSTELSSEPVVPSFERVIELRDRFDRMREAASPGQRRVVDMALAIGTNESDLAEALEVSRGTVAAHLHRFRSLAPST